jgi:hypothetical protein
MEDSAMSTNLFQLTPTVKKAVQKAGKSVDDILRDALNITESGFTAHNGIYFPENTILVAWYKERALSAVIRAGMIEADGKQFSTLSGAAAHFTGRPTTNGWGFWLVRMPGETGFAPISELRKKAA